MSHPALPDRARVVVIGGGIIGTSVAYHLAHLGWKDVVLLERDRLTCGTTWHAAGLMVTFGSTSETSTELRKYTRDLYRRLEAETGQATGFMPVGFIEVAADTDRLEEYRRVAAFNRICGVDVEEISPSRGAAAVPPGEGGRHPGRLLRQGRWPREPGGRRHGARQGRHPRGRPHRRGRGGHGHPAEERPRHRRAHRAGRHRGGVCGQLHRHVGPAAGRADRRRHPQPGGRALLPHHRDNPRSAAGPARAGGPGVLCLLPRGERRPAGRPVRARMRAVEGGGHPGRLLLRRDRARLGPHDALPGDGDGARAGHRRGGHQEILLRPRELHAGSAPHRRRGAGAQELLRGGGAQLHRHPDGRRHRPPAGALDRHRHTRHGRDRHQHRPSAPLPGQPGVPPRPHHRVAGPRLQVPLPDHVAADRTRREAVGGARPAGGGGRLFPRRERLGGRRLVRPAGARAQGGEALLGPGELVSLVGGRASRRTRGRDPHGHVVHEQVPGAGARRRPRPELHLRQQRRWRARHHHLHAVAQRGGAAGGGPHRHQARRGAVPRGRHRYHAPPRRDLAAPPHPGRRPCLRHRCDLRLRPAQRAGAALARAAAEGDERRPRRTRRSRSGQPARSTSASPAHCASASPTSASWATSSISRPSRRRTSTSG